MSPLPDHSKIATPARSKSYFGKYRGQVINNQDPLLLGRILPEVPAIAVVMGWALPCLPYQSPDSLGSYSLPPVGTSVWIEFEAGDLDSPIWSGCFWTTAQSSLAPTSPDPINH